MYIHDTDVYFVHAQRLFVCSLAEATTSREYPLSWRSTISIESSIEVQLQREKQYNWLQSRLLSFFLCSNLAKASTWEARHEKQ